MSDKPYPVGTRVVLVWSSQTSEIADTGTALEETLPGGHVGIAVDGSRHICPGLAQLVAWDSDGEEYFVPVNCLRRLEDPDEESSEEEQRKEETA